MSENMKQATEAGAEHVSEGVGVEAGDESGRWRLGLG